MPKDTHCPVCKISWVSPNTLPEDLLRANPDFYFDIKAAKEGASLYGWTEENDKRFSANVLYVEYAYDHPEHYDGTSEIQCQNCKTRWGVWSGRILKDGEFEKRFGN